MIIIDNFLQDKKILIEIQKEETWSNFPTYNWWDGWWKCKPRNIMEILIEMIWKRLNIENKIAGFEYWSNSQTKNQSLDWHLDKDEKLSLISFMWKIAYADGKLEVDEERLIRRLADLIMIKDLDVLKLKDQFKN